MKVTCQTCQAKYAIADEKVAGKVVKIKCKKCSSTIVVNGVGASPASAPPPGEVEDEEGEGDTKIFVDPTQGPAVEAAANADEWTVNVTDDDQRTMTTPQIAKEIGGGVVTADTYVWKDGMADWLPVSDVPELASFLTSGPPAPPPSSPADLGFGAVVPVAAKSAAVSPRAAAAPAAPAAASTAAASSGAARRAGAARGNVDLFGASKEPAAAAAPPPAAAAAAASGHVGERNENSVLFSLSALTATENAAKASARKSDHALLDMGSGPPKPKAKNGGRGNFDDIMNLGGGGIGGGMTSPALAPPPLLAPVVEAPVRASVPAPAAASRGATSFAPGPISTKKKGGSALLVVILAALVLAGGGAFFFLKGAKPAPEATATPSATPDSTSAAIVSAAPTAAPAPVDSATAAPAVTASATPSAAPDATAVPAAPTAVAAVGGTKPGGPLPATTTATPSTKPASAPTPAPADTPAPAAGGGAEFSRSAAASALGGAAGAAKGCKKGDGPTGSGRVKVTFAPSGNVTTATVDGPPFAGTSMGGCIASAFRGAHVPPFDGSPVTVTKSFSIN